MATLYTQKDKNIRLSWLYVSLFFVFVILIGWFFSFYFQNQAILWGAFIFAILMNFASFWWSDKIILSMNGAQEVTFDNAKELYRLVENLCITAGLPLPKIYLIDDPSPNAFATGRNPENAAIALTTGLVEKLEKSELEGVIAHELSHIGNRDILLSMIITTLVGFVILLSDWFWRWSFFGGGRDDDNKGNSQIRLFFSVVAIIFIVLAPIFATLMQLAISRKREFLADADGALLTRYPEGLARALEKIAADPYVFKRANTATAHLFIANPFKKNPIRKIGNLFATHPPIEERIKRLREMA